MSNLLTGELREIPLPKDQLDLDLLFEFLLGDGGYSLSEGDRDRFLASEEFYMQVAPEDHFFSYKLIRLGPGKHADVETTFFIDDLDIFLEAASPDLEKRILTEVL